MHFCRIGNMTTLSLDFVEFELVRKWALKLKHTASRHLYVFLSIRFYNAMGQPLAMYSAVHVHHAIRCIATQLLNLQEPLLVSETPQCMRSQISKVVRFVLRKLQYDIQPVRTTASYKNIDKMHHMLCPMPVQPTFSVITRCRKLGQGSFGVVHKVHIENSFDGSERYSAMKRFVPNTGWGMQPWLRELWFLRRLCNEPICVELLGVSYLKIYTELGYSSLFLFDKERLKPDVWRILDDLIAGMSRIHDSGIVHRDLKTANIIVQTCEDVLEIKIIDWSAALDVRTETIPDFGVTTYAYKSPEQFGPCEDDIDFFKADVWSLGCIIMEVVNNGKLLFNIDEKSHPTQEFFVKTVTNAVQTIPKQYRTRVAQMLAYDPEKRPNLRDLIPFTS